MEKKKGNRRVLVIATIIIAAIILWYLLRGKDGSLTTIINQAGEIPAYDIVDPFVARDLPAINYQGSNYIGSGSGCLLCYKGYTRLAPVTPPAPAPVAIPPAQIYNFIQAQPKEREIPRYWFGSPG